MAWPSAYLGCAPAPSSRYQFLGPAVCPCANPVQENQPPNHPSNTSAETQIASAGQHAVSAGQQTISAGQQTISDAGVAMSTDALDPQLNLATLLLSKPPLNLPRQASWGKRDPTESWAGSNSHLLRGDVSAWEWGARLCVCTPGG